MNSRPTLLVVCARRPLRHRRHNAIRSRRLFFETLEPRLVLADASTPAILQIFDGSYRTIERRAADIFDAGYGTVYSPPPGRADQGNLSVGYDAYDRFDLGSPGNPTLYGTEAGLMAAVDRIHQLGGNYVLDTVWNHDGFSDSSTADGVNRFVDAGDYPGFVTTLAGGDVDGDFHGAFEGGDLNGRLSGLIDIAHDKNHQFIRSPVPGFANNIPAGTTPVFGRLADVPDENNRRFYPDQQQSPIMLFDPTIPESDIPFYPFNNAAPLAGDPTPENALGYLMRNAQWLVQHIGVDGFRIDAAKHFERFVLNYFDRAVYRSSLRPLLDGSQPNIFAFSEVFDGDKNLQQTFIRKDINPADPGRIGGNRDVLDFPLFLALQSNLTDNGLSNDWRNIVNASQDSQDDGLANNGSQGVAFVASHDSFGPYLSNVAYAHTLLRPGNAIVYFNAKEFGDGRDFPKDGRGDALGGQYGDTLKRLVQIRESHGRGNYIERWLEKELLGYEREDSALVLLSNRLDGGFDSRTLQTSFAPGTRLIELTGNAADPVVDPAIHDDLPELVEVNIDGTVNVRFPRNRNPDGVEHDKGFLIYGLATPQGTLSLSNIDHTLASETPTAATNGTARLAAIDVITANQFDVRLDTVAVNLLGNTNFRDRPADGDNALLKIDGGLDLNGNGNVDYVTPGNVAYGFEDFVSDHHPGFFDVLGAGLYRQTIDTTRLSEGTHFVTARAFRHREPNEGEPVFTDFQRTIYVDRLPPQSAVASFSPLVSGVNENRRALVRSTDLTADNVHVFFDLPAAKTNAEILALVGGGSQSNQLDRDLFAKDFSSVTSGNHVLTVVTYEISGNVNVQRFAGQSTSTIFGRGLGDLDFDGSFSANDITLFRDVLLSRNSQFNAAADVNGDGFVDLTDLAAMRTELQNGGADEATMTAYQSLVDDFTLQISVTPGTIAENGGANAATVTITRSLAVDAGSLNVTLTNSDSTETLFSLAVTIPANQASTSIPLEAVDDNLLDGPQTVSITASAAGVFFTGTRDLTVNDYETLTVTIDSPAISERGGSTTATVTRSNDDDLSQPLTVTLASSDTTEATTPISVTIPANLSSATFTITAEDDDLLDGDQSVTITATAAGYVTLPATMTVTDYETLSLTLAAAAIAENAGLAATTGTVTRGNVADLSQSLIVTLTNSDPSEASVPLTVTIPTNAAAADFSIDAVDDNLLDGTQPVFITAAALGFVSSPAATLDVTDFETLTVAINAAAVSERGGATSATITRSNLSDMTADLVVTLVSSDATAATVPPNVTIPSGESFATFSIMAVDDDLLDGTQSVMISATAAGYVGNAKSLDVTDHETLTVTLDLATISEFGGAALGTVRRNNTDISQPLDITLASSDTTEATVPATVTIPANQSSATFAIIAVDDNLLDGTQSVMIAATAAGYVGDAKSLDVTDHETLTVTIAAASVAENAGAAATTGTVSRSNTETSLPLVVTLASDNPSAAVVAATVTIPANQTSATFPIDAVDDTRLDGVQTATITATAAGYSGGGASLDVTDFETLTVSITPATIGENGGLATGTVTRSNSDTGQSLLVTLTGDDNTAATVPATVTIPVNQASATFDITSVDDTLFDATQRVTISATAAGYISVSAALDVTDNEHLFPWHNARRPADVDDVDGVIPLDALIVINLLNSAGPGALPVPPDADFRPPPYYDVIADNFLAPNDALAIINVLNGAIAGEGESLFEVFVPPAVPSWIDANCEFVRTCELFPPESSGAKPGSAPARITRPDVPQPSFVVRDTHLRRRPLDDASPFEETLSTIAADVFAGWCRRRW